jgi:hypothetical protein
VNYDTYGQGSRAEIMDGLRHQLQVLRNRWRNIVGEEEYIGRYLDCAVAGMVVEVQIVHEREQRGRHDNVLRFRQAIKESVRGMEGL